MALSTMEFCAYILPRPIQIRALLGAVSAELCAKQRHEIGPWIIIFSLVTQWNKLKQQIGLYTYLNMDVFTDTLPTVYIGLMALSCFESTLSKIIAYLIAVCHLEDVLPFSTM